MLVTTTVLSVLFTTPTTRAFVVPLSQRSLVISSSSTVHAPLSFFPLYNQVTTSTSSNNDEDAAAAAEIEAQVQAELEKTKRISNLRNEKGVEYAPWMRISEEEEDKIRRLMKEKAVARQKRQEQERKVQGALLADSQAQELSGTGLRSKIVNGNSVELEWATASEKATKGWRVKRRPAKTDDFEVIASYETFGPLASKGPDGGVYRYLDPDLPVGTSWVYRITECEANGRENDLSQCLVDIQSQEEQRGALLAVAAFGAVAVAAVIAGTMLDPVQY